jgi:hypothetical protein
VGSLRRRLSGVAVPVAVASVLALGVSASSGPSGPVSGILDSSPWGHHGNYAGQPYVRLGQKVGFGFPIDLKRSSGYVRIRVSSLRFGRWPQGLKAVRRFSSRGGLEFTRLPWSVPDLPIRQISRTVLPRFNPDSMTEAELWTVVRSNKPGVYRVTTPIIRGLVWGRTGPPRHFKEVWGGWHFAFCIGMHYPDCTKLDPQGFPH